MERQTNRDESKLKKTWEKNTSYHQNKLIKKSSYNLSAISLCFIYNRVTWLKPIARLATERDGAAIERDGAVIECDDACGVVG